MTRDDQSVSSLRDVAIRVTIYLNVFKVVLTLAKSRSVKSPKLPDVTIDWQGAVDRTCLLKVRTPKYSSLFPVIFTSNFL